MASTCPLGLYYPAVSACIEAGGGCDLEGKSSRVLGRLNMGHLHIQVSSTLSPSSSSTSSSTVAVASNSNDTKSNNNRSVFAPRVNGKGVAETTAKGKTVTQGYDATHPPTIEIQQQIMKSMSMQAGRAVFPIPTGIYLS